MTNPITPPAFQRLWAVVDKNGKILYAIPSWSVMDTMAMPKESDLRFIKCKIMNNRQVKLWDAQHRKEGK